MSEVNKLLMAAGFRQRQPLSEELERTRKIIDAKVRDTMRFVYEHALPGFAIEFGDEFPTITVTVRNTPVATRAALLLASRDRRRKRHGARLMRRAIAEEMLRRRAAFYSGPLGEVYERREP